MPSSVTFTGNIGPGKSVTSLVFNNVVGVNFRLDSRAIDIKQSDPNKITTIDYDDTNAVTYTITGQNAEIAISNS